MNNNTLAYQVSIIVYIITDDSFRRRFLPYIKPDYFSDSSLSLILHRCKKLWEEYNTLGWSLIENEIEKRDYKKLRDLIKEEQILPRQYVEDKLEEFVKKQEVTQALRESIKYLEKEEYDNIRRRIDKALIAGLETDIGTDYFRDIDKRYKRKEKGEIVRTSIASIDKELGGGLRRGELTVILGPPGSGKTFTMINFTKGALIYGYSVAYYTLEMSEASISYRYDSLISKISLNKLWERKEEVKKKVHKNLTTDKVIIKEFPTGTLTIDSLKAHLEQMRLNGVIPDIIVVDYADLMRPRRGRAERRFELQEIYTDLRGLAVENNASLLTASQTNRRAIDKTTISIGDLSEDFQKAAISDVIISISSSEEERAKGVVNLYGAKVRGGKGGWKLEFKANWEYASLEPV